MYSFTAHKKPPLLRCLCACGRSYIIEEMYACFNGNHAVCRFCLSQSIHNYNCRNCKEAVYPADAHEVRNLCSKCVSCPVCKNALQLMTKTDSSKTKLFYYGCQFCFYSTVSNKLTSPKVEELLNKILKQFINNVDPKQVEYERVKKEYVGQQTEYKQCTS